MSEPDKLLSAATVASLLGIKPQSLRVRRMRSAGPPFLRLSDSPSARAYYRESDVLRYLAERPTFSGTLEEKAALRSRAETQGA